MRTKTLEDSHALGAKSTNFGGGGALLARTHGSSQTRVGDLRLPSFSTFFDISLLLSQTDNLTDVFKTSHFHEYRIIRLI
jgi:hypothetical protein